MATRVNPDCRKRPPINPHEPTVGGRFACQAQPWQAERLPYNDNTHAFARPGRATNLRTKYITDARASTIPVTAHSRAVACARIQKIATIASAGTIFMPGKLKGWPSDRTSRCTRIQQAAQQSRYINNTATFESTASCSNVPLSDNAKASAAYVMIATSGDR